MRQKLQIIYDNALGYIKELNKIIRRNKTHSYNMMVLSFLGLGLLIQKIDIQELYSGPSLYKWLMFGSGLLCWLSALVSFAMNLLPSSIDLSYTRPKELLREEFLNQDDETAIRGLCDSIDKGIENMHKVNKKLTVNNRRGLILFSLSFLILLIYWLIFV